jgi:hypothetical protein
VCLINKKCPQNKVAHLESAASLNSESTDSAVLVVAMRLQSPHLVSVALVRLLLDLVTKPPIHLPWTVERWPVVPLASSDPRLVPTCF